MPANPQGVEFEIHVIGDETNELFPGKFRAKEKLSWNDQISIDRYRRELLGPNSGEANVTAFKRCDVIAELAFRLTDAPEWWKTSRGGLDLIDDNVVLKVYDEAISVSTKWREDQQKKGEAARAALSLKQAEDTGGKPGKK